jgi:hydrogenase expression/formation protein HypC
LCLAVPARLVERHDEAGVIELGGLRRTISLALTPEAKVGDYVIVHAGFAISVLDEEQASETLRLLAELASAIPPDDLPPSQP